MPSSKSSAHNTKVVVVTILVMTSPNWTSSWHFRVILPALLCVPSILRMDWGFQSFCIGNWNLVTIHGSRKFSVAPLSKRAASVFGIVVNIISIVRAFHFDINIQCVFSTHAATTSEGDSKNLVLPSEGQRDLPSFGYLGPSGCVQGW